MANEEVMNEMDMENEGTLITLEDEEGNEVEFEFLDIVEYDGEEYIVLIENDEDADEVVILKINPVDEETEEYVSIEDEDLLDKLFDIFKKKYEGEINFCYRREIQLSEIQENEIQTCEVPESEVPETEIQESEVQETEIQESEVPESEAPENERKPRKLLITGGTNFVSRYTAEYFAATGYEVTVLNRGSREQAEGVTLIQADRTDLGGALDGLTFDAVLDICGYTEEHVVKLLDALGDDFKGPYILLSSSAVYPEGNPQPFEENQPTGENYLWGGYGTNKIAAENALRERMENAYILRPPYLYGKYESLYREPFIFDCARGDRKCYIPEKEMSLQFFNVRDLCRFMELILETQPENKVFNVGNPQTVTVKEWVTLCYEAAGKTPEILRVSDSFPQRSYFPFHNYDYRLDVSKMLALMPELTPLDEGLKEEYEWYAETDPPMDRKSYFEYIDNNLA